MLVLTTIIKNQVDVKKKKNQTKQKKCTLFFFIYIKNEKLTDRTHM